MISNPPGLDALAYRVGTHGTFLETMRARLTTHELVDRRPPNRPLQRLTARTPDDFSIALLDAWATVGDVLTFYQERIANEGYRRTAVERRSLLELGRLIGYELRPGLSSTAFLAFTIADDPATQQGVTVPAGTRAQSLPPPGGLPASFETSEDVFTRPEWNTLLPRMERPQRIDFMRASFVESIVLEGIVPTIAAGSVLLFEFGDGEHEQVVRSVTDVKHESERKRTIVTLALTSRARLRRVLELGTMLFDATPGAAPATAARVRGALRSLCNHVVDALARGKELDDLSGRLKSLGRLAAASLESSGLDDATRAWAAEVLRFATEAPADDEQEPTGTLEPPEQGSDPIAGALAALTGPLTRPPSHAPATQARLRRDPRALFGAGSDLAVQMLSVLRPELAPSLTQALSKARLTTAAPLKALYGLSRRAQPFGATAPRAPKYKGTRLIGTVEWRLDGSAEGIESEGAGPHTKEIAALDGVYAAVSPGSWVVVQRRAQGPEFDRREDDLSLDPRRAQSVATRGVAAYNMAASVTTLRLGAGWLDARFDGEDWLTPVRRTALYLEAQPLTLAHETIDEDVRGVTVALNGVVGGLLTGRRLIVTGERTDIPGVTGVLGGELVMLAAETQRVDTTLPGDTVHTVLQLATALQYSYRRSSVTIWGNVARSTQGETHAEVLGGGNPARPMQTFRLRLGPLTYLPAANARGAVDTLEVRVDGVAWHETDDLTPLRPGDRTYIARTDDDGATSVIVGSGARLPSGPDNVRAIYRVGSGVSGNVDANKITNLLTRPLGVRDVVNPLRATGGADREGVASARRNLPIGLTALDRLVSVGDYADFACARAGIGKASALRISNGREQLLHLTITGADDAPVDESSDLVVALREALVGLGDPNLPLVLGVRDLRLIVLVADVRVLADHAWSDVEPRLRAALLGALGFDRRELGEPVVLSKILAAAQQVPGVDAVDVQGLALAPEAITPLGLEALAQNLMGTPPERIAVEVARTDEEGGRILPAQIALLTPRVPDTLILREGLP